MAHAVAAERCGRAPCSIASGRLSTLARMSRPIWVRYSTSRSPMATTIATPKVNRSWYVTLTSKRLRRCSGNSSGTRYTSCGGQIHWATPRMATRRLTVMMIRIVSGASTSPRMIPRSIPTPSVGAMTSTTVASASGIGHPQSTCSCQ